MPPVFLFHIPAQDTPSAHTGYSQMPSSSAPAFGLWTSDTLLMLPCHHQAISHSAQCIIVIRVRDYTWPAIVRDS